MEWAIDGFLLIYQGDGVEKDLFLEKYEFRTNDLV